MRKGNSPWISNTGGFNYRVQVEMRVSVILATCNRYNKGKGCKLMALGDAHGLPIAIHTEAAAPAEVKLVEATLAARLVEEKPLRIIADKACDSDPLREQLLAE